MPDGRCRRTRSAWTVRERRASWRNGGSKRKKRNSPQGFRLASSSSRHSAIWPRHEPARSGQLPTTTSRWSTSRRFSQRRYADRRLRAPGFGLRASVGDGLQAVPLVERPEGRPLQLYDRCTLPAVPKVSVTVITKNESAQISAAL